MLVPYHIYFCFQLSYTVGLCQADSQCTSSRLGIECVFSDERKISERSPSNQKSGGVGGNPWLYVGRVLDLTGVDNERIVHELERNGVFEMVRNVYAEIQRLNNTLCPGQAQHQQILYTSGSNRYNNSFSGSRATLKNDLKMKNEIEELS